MENPIAPPTLPAWAKQSACSQVANKQIFNPMDLRGRYHLEEETAAKIICGGCAVRSECLNFALETMDTTYRILGGKSRKERMFELAPRLCPWVENIIEMNPVPVELIPRRQLQAA